VLAGRVRTCPCPIRLSSSSGYAAISRVIASAVDHPLVARGAALPWDANAFERLRDRLKIAELELYYVDRTDVRHTMVEQRQLRDRLRARGRAPSGPLNQCA
jgi:hypothetical protein